jgi:short-subunit dehydrogenase
MTVKGKNVIITGATGGIGSAIARALDAAGCKLLLTGRSQIKLTALLSGLEGRDHVMLATDLTSRAGVEQLAEAAAPFGASVLVNCLGVNQFAALGETNHSDVDRIIETNLNAPINVCRALLPLLESQQKATIINVGSILGSIGYAGSTVYCASKFGLRGFTEALRRELADTHIKVSYFAPRATHTELNSERARQMNEELGNAVDSPEWVAQQLVSAMAADKSLNRYLGWPERFFVRLNGLLPSVVDNALSRQLATIKRYCRVSQSADIINRRAL